MDRAKVVVRVPCPDCKELSPEPAERVAMHDVIPCSLCGGLIDLSSEDCMLVVDAAMASHFSVESTKR